MENTSDIASKKSLRVLILEKLVQKENGSGWLW